MKKFLILPTCLLLSFSSLQTNTSKKKTESSHQVQVSGPEQYGMLKLSLSQMQHILAEVKE